MATFFDDPAPRYTFACRESPFLGWVMNGLRRRSISFFSASWRSRSARVG